MTPTALTVAGSDSSGGAGIAADLKTFAALEVYGLAAITAVTAQSTVEIDAIHAVPPTVVRRQIDVVARDFAIGAIKTGMLHSVETIETVAAAIAQHRLRAVIDPVMIAETGTALLQRDAIPALDRALLPHAELLTPNIPEAEALLGRRLGGVEDRIEAARALRARGPKAVLLKGGHARGEPIDVLVLDRDRVLVFQGTRIDTRATHGTGCTYSAAIAAGLARGERLESAVEKAHAYVRAAMQKAPELGRGRGPLHHLHPFYAWPAE